MVFLWTPEDKFINVKSIFTKKKKKQGWEPYDQPVDAHQPLHNVLLVPQSTINECNAVSVK